MTINPATSRQQRLCAQLHEDFAPGAYDNWVVWAGAMSVQIDDLVFDATLARAYVDADHPARMRVRVEVFFGAVEAAQIRSGEVEARLWTDASGASFVPMSLVASADGTPHLCEGNLVFQSEPVLLQQPGTFTYTVEFSADGLPADDEMKRWVPLNDLAPNQDGVVVVSPRWVEAGPTMMEVCLRKLGARLDRTGAFCSGHIQDLTAVVADLPVDVIYLLPFYRPGFTDRHTGKDVRKGELGSPYAVADFFALDPMLVPPPDQIDLSNLQAQGLIEVRDVEEIFGDRVTDPAQLVQLGAVGAAAQFGEDPVRQLVGRAHLRALTRRAHEAGKRVIFDLVLMQTSRDHDLIQQHPDWYVQEADGRPAIHRIAWLEYSDVALFDLVFNRPLQQYLLDIAPFWMERCDLDGVRIDASQTVDRPFLRQLHNRIHQTQPDALVLGETLCPLEEALDIPVDMIYALLVDFHRDADTATGLIDFLEMMHSSFAAGTVAKAYFENHDSPRATAVWEERYALQLSAVDGAHDQWAGLSQHTMPVQRLMAVAKNLQATLINATLGMAPVAAPVNVSQRPMRSGGSRLAWALEWGTQWGETERTDFEHAGLLQPQLSGQPPGDVLVEAYQRLPEILSSCPELQDGKVYYHRGASAADHVLAATRYVPGSALVILHNLDPVSSHSVEIDLSSITADPVVRGVIYDSYDALHLAPQPASVKLYRSEDRVSGGDARRAVSLRTNVAPLQSRILRLSWPPSSTTVSGPMSAAIQPECSRQET